MALDESGHSELQRQGWRDNGERRLGRRFGPIVAAVATRAHRAHPWIGTAARARERGGFPWDGTLRVRGFTLRVRWVEVSLAQIRTTEHGHEGTMTDSVRVQSPASADAGPPGDHQPVRLLGWLAAVGIGGAILIMIGAS